MRFRIEALIGDRYDSTDSLTEAEQLFELIKTSIKKKNYKYEMAKGHLWFELDITVD